MSSNKKTTDTKKSTRVKKDKVIELVEPVTDDLLTEKEKEMLFQSLQDLNPND
jgi:hypothetical protein